MSERAGGTDTAGAAADCETSKCGVDSKEDESPSCESTSIGLTSECETVV
jgi:hypothetical protein